MFLSEKRFFAKFTQFKKKRGWIDALILIYKNILPKMYEYLTNGKGQLNLKQC